MISMVTPVQLPLTFLGLGATFMLGFVASLTPCIYPMIPITMGVIGARASESGATPRRMRSFFLSIVYVMGMAVTYSSFGLAAAGLGQIFGAVFQQRWIIVLASFLLILFGLSYFGLYELRMPRMLAGLGGGPRRKGGLAAVFLLGLGSGLILSPCVSPFLFGLLTVVATTKSYVAGYLHLFVFALGMGGILVLVGTFGGMIMNLPKSGFWLDVSRRFLGVLLIVSGIYLFLQSEVVKSSTRKVVDRDPLIWFTDERLAQQEAGLRRLPILVDFYAEWCELCIELENKTFANEKVKQTLRNQVILFRVDATRSNQSASEMLRKYRVVGLPSMVFVSPRGNEIPQLRLAGYVSPEELLEFLFKNREVLKSKARTDS